MALALTGYIVGWVPVELAAFAVLIALLMIALERWPGAADYDPATRPHGKAW